MPVAGGRTLEGEPVAFALNDPANAGKPYHFICPLDRRPRAASRSTYASACK